MLKVTKVKDAQVMGVYRPTSVDAVRASVDFRLTSVGARNTIVWRSGVVERVTDSKLSKLQSLHTWTTDM